MEYYPSSPLADAMAEGRTSYTWQDLTAELDATEYMTPDLTREGRVRHHTPNYLITVDGGCLLFVKARDVSIRGQGPSLVLRPEEWKGPRAKAGGSTWLPTTSAEVLEACRRVGLVVKHTKRHYSIETADGKTLAHFPVSGSDWRGVRNAVALLARSGVDLRRRHR